jgi:hypothetical protein
MLEHSRRIARVPLEIRDYLLQGWPDCLIDDGSPGKSRPWRLGIYKGIQVQLKETL